MGFDRFRTGPYPFRSRMCHNVALLARDSFQGDHRSRDHYSRSTQIGDFEANLRMDAINWCYTEVFYMRLMIVQLSTFVASDG